MNDCIATTSQNDRHLMPSARTVSNVVVTFKQQ